MSVPSNPAAQAAKPRPGSVTISSYLLYLVAALQVIIVIVELSVLNTVRDVYEDAFAGTELADSGATFAVVSLVIMSVIRLLAAAGLVVLAIFNNRGSNASRIVTWVVGALSICCCSGLIVGSFTGNVFGTGDNTDPNMPDQAEIQRNLADQLPSWYTPVTVTLGVISVLALLVALILLALPASNEFFRKPTSGWAPPAPGATYPGHPQAQQPGYPQAQQPGHPQGYPPAAPPASPGTPPSTPPSPPSGPPSSQHQPPSPPSEPPTT